MIAYGYSLTKNKRPKNKVYLIKRMAAPVAPPAALPKEFRVGKYNKTYDGWRRMTAAEWKDPAIQAKLLEAHREGGGWTLLEDPLVCNYALCVDNGVAMIDEVSVAEVGNTVPFQQLRGRYRAMNNNTKVAWTTTEPALGNNWTVRSWVMSDYPCLFVINDPAALKAAVAAPPAPTTVVAAPAPTTVVAAAAASNTPDASSGATTSSIGSNSVKPLRYVRTLDPVSKLTTPITTINVHVYKIGEDIRKTIDQFKDHLFAVVNTNKTPPETTVYTQPDFIAFLKSQPVVPISQSSLPIDDVATAVAIAAAIAAPTVETAPP